MTKGPRYPSTMSSYTASELEAAEVLSTLSMNARPSLDAGEIYEHQVHWSSVTPTADPNVPVTRGHSELNSLETQGHLLEMGYAYTYRPQGPAKLEKDRTLKLVTRVPTEEDDSDDTDVDEMESEHPPIPGNADCIEEASADQMKKAPKREPRLRWTAEQDAAILEGRARNTGKTWRRIIKHEYPCLSERSLTAIYSRHSRLI